MKKIFIILILASTQSCASLRDEYAFMAKEYVLPYNQQPYIDAVRAIDAKNSSALSSRQLARTQYSENYGSILYVSPNAPIEKYSKGVHCHKQFTYHQACD